jgi:hypothetical protein
MMGSVAEQKLCRSLQAILADLPDRATIPDSEQFREVLVCLQYFIPVILAEVHREWRFQGLDDVLPVMARKTVEGEVEILGLCCFVSDQTLTPFHLRLQVAVSAEDVSWLECRLGERGPQGMVRMPFHSLNAARKRLYLLTDKASLIDWVYQVTFGHRRI